MFIEIKCSESLARGNFLSIVAINFIYVIEVAENQEKEKSKKENEEETGMYQLYNRYFPFVELCFNIRKQ